jgi:hypothetical protein
MKSVEQITGCPSAPSGIEENSGDVMLPLDEPGEAICFWAKPFFGGSIPKNL